MTIRLRCTECQRKLKVPDEALGKKVQCPACGARFVGRLEPNPPPSPAKEPAATKPAPTAAPPEDAAPVPNLQLEEPSPLEAIEPLDIDALATEEALAVSEAAEAEPIPPGDEGVEPIVMEDESVLDFSEAAEEPAAIDGFEEIAEIEEGIDPEIVDEVETEEAKPRPKKPKSRTSLYVWLAIGILLLLGCLAGAYAVYRYMNGTLLGSNQKLHSPPGQPQIRRPPIAPAQPVPSAQR